MSYTRTPSPDEVEEFQGGDRKRRKLSDNAPSSAPFEASKGMERMLPAPSPRIKPKRLRQQEQPSSKIPEETELMNGKLVDKNASFATINVAPWLLVSLSAMEVKRPTAIQKVCIPDILDGRSVIGISKTGSGKTLTFAIPMLQKLAEDPRGIFGLILTPTRELALQIYEQIKAISFRFELKAALVTGGPGWLSQARELTEKPHIVVATPGRLAEHIEFTGAEFVRALKRIKMLVLDEADRLLAEDAGMLPALDVCLDALPPSQDRQTCLFTATVTSQVLALKDAPRKDGTPPISVYEVAVDDPSGVPKSLHLTYLLVPVQYRDAYLHELLSTPENSKRRSVIVFANKKTTVNVLDRLLRGLGHSVASLHSALPQAERTANLSKFRASMSRILVATDLASRGLDIPDVSLVINYDVPASPDDYIHRVGRTGRAGRDGEALTLIGPRDVDRIKAIEDRVGRQMVEFKEEGVNIETRVLRDAVKVVGETKRKTLIGIDEGRDAKGNKNTRKLKRAA